MINVPKKIKIKESTGRGLGVFASEKIFKDEVIEITPLVKLNDYDSQGILYDYIFTYPKNSDNGLIVISLGYGSLYNHSNQNNADWRTADNMKFEFFATKDIEIGEEIFICYGPKEYFDERKKIKWV